MCGEEHFIFIEWANGIGTPPRVWGRANFQLQSIRPIRDTPTCVGKSQLRSLRLLRAGGHPHVCGEELVDVSIVNLILGTPPRVWGRAYPPAVPCLPCRDTPTCVGKSNHLGKTDQATGHPTVWGRAGMAALCPDLEDFTCVEELQSLRF